MNSPEYNYCHVVGRTDVGRKRSANEDNMFNSITQNGLVSVVCDGMGGHVGGATASQIAVTTIIENLNNIYYDDPRVAIGESIDKANRAIIQKTVEKPELIGMGSTCVLLLVREGKVYIGHVGDSRIYLVRSKKIIQLTKDHSFVQMLVDRGEITKEQAEHHPRKNEITNALGIPNMSPATIADDAIVPEAGDCFVLCSDGLSGMVSDDKICKIIGRQSEMNAQERIDRLIELANENGGLDNITVQLVEFPVSPNTIDERKKLPTWTKTTCAILILMTLGYATYQLLKKPRPVTDNDSYTTESPLTAHSDTVDYLYPNNIPFEKNAKIVELEFKESSLILKRNGIQIYQFTDSFDQNSLNVETPNIEVQYNNSLLSFKEQTPGDSIIFYIAQSDKSRTWRCKFNVHNKGDSFAQGFSINSKVKGEKPDKKDDKNAMPTKIDTINVQFEYDKLENGTKLLLNYSAKPILIFNKEEEKVNSPVLGKVLDDITFDDLHWAKEPKKGQLLFTFKGESSNKEHTIVIPCLLKDSNVQIVISVKIAPKQSEKDEDATLES